MTRVLAGGNPTPASILRWFDSQHLKAELVVVADRFAELARWVDDALPMGAEKYSALRYLLIAKDAAVRSAIEGREQGP